MARSQSGRWAILLDHSTQGQAVDLFEAGDFDEEERDVLASVGQPAQGHLRVTPVLMTSEEIEVRPHFIATIQDGIPRIPKKGLD